MLFNFAFLGFGIFVSTQMFGYATNEIATLSLVILLLHMVMFLLPHTVVVMLSGPFLVVFYLLLMVLTVVYVFLCLPCLVYKKIKEPEAPRAEEVPIENFGQERGAEQSSNLNLRSQSIRFEQNNGPNWL